MCYRRGNRSPRRKTSPPPSKQSIIYQRMKLGYMSSRRPSKPNLPNVPNPSKLLTPTRLCQTFVFSSLLDPAIHPIATTKPYRLLLAMPQSFPSSKTLSTFLIGVSCAWVQISSQSMTIEKGWKRGYNDFSLKMSSSLSKRWVCVLQKTYLGFFSLNGLLYICG